MRRCYHAAAHNLRPYVVRGASPESLLAAHSALSATTASSSALSFSNNGPNRRSALLPIAITAFRRRPLRLARRTADPRNFSRNSSALIPASHSSAGLTSPSLG